MNNRANIMYFLEHLADMATRESHPDYVRMMQRDILRIVDAVAPEDGSGAANVKVIQKVLASLASKNYLLPQTVSEIEECLRERDQALPKNGITSSPVMGTGMDVEEREEAPIVARLDKKQIEQRIEEDRERHKRLREHQWAVAAEGDDDEREFGMLMDETSSLGSDDYRLFEEEEAERKRCAEEHAEEMEGGLLSLEP
jgi:CTD kinase subunit gamma